MLFLFNWSLGLLFAVIHVLIRKPRSLADRLKLFLLYQMVFAIGISGLVGVFRALSQLRTNRKEYRVGTAQAVSV